VYIVKHIVSCLCNSVIQVIVNCLLAFCSANISIVVSKFILFASDLSIKSILYYICMGNYSHVTNLLDVLQPKTSQTEITIDQLYFNFFVEMKINED